MTHLSNNALNKSQKSESNIFDSAAKNKGAKHQTGKLNFDHPNLLESKINSEINLFNVGPDMNSAMKKTLEANNREKDIREESKNGNSRFTSPKKSDADETHKSAFSSSMKLAAYRASELKKRNKELIRKYSGNRRIYNEKQERGFIKMVHSAAITIQN